MKKTLLLIVLMLALCTSFALAGNDKGSLSINIKPTTPGSVQTPFPKSPVQIPVVYLDGNILSFDSSIEGCTIQLLDEDENVIFSHFIEENETSLTLPSYLSGTYELQIIRGNITFYAFIEL